MISLFRVTLARWGSAARALVMQGRSAADAPDDELEAVQPIGLHARAPVRSSSEALVLELPSGDRFAFPLDKGSAEGAVEAEEGETQLYGAGNAAVVVRLRADGDIEITPAAGRSVILAGGTANVARAGDPVSVSIPIGAVMIPHPTTGLPVPNPTPIPLTGATITSGNPRVKA